MASTLFYVTVDEMKLYLPHRLLGALTNDQEGDFLPISEILETTIQAAEDEVNSYLAKRYNVPVKARNGDVPIRIKTLVYSIAKYHAYTRAALLSPEISQEYDNAITFLNRIATGRATMPALDDTGSDANSEDYDMPSGSNHENVFGGFRP